jgi:acetylornithine deacetylase
VSASVHDLLRDLVRTPSVSGDEGALADLVGQWLGRAGIEHRRVGNSVLGRLVLGDGSGPRLLLLSHLDTVPVGTGWTVPALEPEWSAGRLVGRGANDAKASAAAMLWTLASLAREREEASGELVLALTANEETDNSGMRAVLGELGRLDGAVCGEPTGLEVVRAQAGLAILRAEWRGRSCHAAHAARAEHENALLAAAAEVARLPRWLEVGSEHPLLGRSTVVPTVFRSGTRHNVVPDQAELVLDARLAPPQDAARALALLRERLPSAECAILSERLQPIETPEEHPLVQAALRCAGRARALGSMTLSDMALLQGIPAVKCGPGETARSHTPDEFVLAHELAAGADFYRRLALEALSVLIPEEVSR